MHRTFWLMAQDIRRLCYLHGNKLYSRGTLYVLYDSKIQGGRFKGNVQYSLLHRDFIRPLARFRKAFRDGSRSPLKN